MRGGGRIETFVLIVAAATVLAFGISLVAGVRRPADPGATGADVWEEPAPDGSRVRVEVLNGAGRPGLAERVTARLRSEGFDVVFFGNATRFDWERSLVYARSADTLRARAVAEALGIERVESEADPALHLDATVVLGRSWTAPSPPPSRLRMWLERVRAWVGRGGEGGW
ncbi:MAG: LytR C-terminal domain-containing protein [Gemmatimonadota bacterium]